MFNIFQNRGRPYFSALTQNSTKLLRQLLYPLKCLRCGVYLDPVKVNPYTMEACFCDLCMELGIYPIDRAFCIKCGVKFPVQSCENHVCEACLKTPLKLDRVRAAVEYKGIIKEAIPLFKYQSKLCLANVFEQMLFQAFLFNYQTQGIDIVMPVPLHKKKLRTRGFNQAFLLVRNFAKHYVKAFEQSPSWEIDTISLVRIKRTKPQTGFDIDQRKDNLKNAFKVVNQKIIDKKHILLIDDVFTTGATCNEAAGTLLKQGAKKVDALVLART